MSETYCNNCGHRNAEGSNFCSSCGQPLDRSGDEPATITFHLDQASEDEVVVELQDVGHDGVMLVTRGPNAGSSFALEHEVTTAGRHPDSDIFLDDVTVSRRHVEIVRGADGYTVRDVGSLNGTYLNRERIEEGPLANGDELQVGKFKLVFVAGGED
ncbi:MAG: domain containing protein [Acidimicrobiales bacterium]|nr:domain containing protein [Acidimicrobiales bacterium]